MSKYSLELIEDCSPFYIRFTFDDLQKLIDYVKSNADKIMYSDPMAKNYSHLSLQLDVAQNIINMLPFKDIATFIRHRVSIFDTPPGGGSPIHKDGVDNRVSFNIVLTAQDDLCETTWYDEADFQAQPVPYNSYSRIIHWDHHTMGNIYQPIKRLVAKENEMIFDKRTGK